MTTELTEEEKKLRKKALAPVDGTFFYHSKPGCKIAFKYQSFWEEEPQEFVLVDKQKTTVPQYLKDAINNEGYIERHHDYLLDSDGNAIGIGKTTREQVYSFV